METLSGIGMMIGPFLGGVLYHFDGFYLPFVTCGGTLVILSGVSGLILRPEDLQPAISEESLESVEVETTSYRQLLSVPLLLYCSFMTAVSGMSTSWFLPSLQVRMCKKSSLYGKL